MKIKNNITAFLICLMVLQLLPVKQVIRYFFIDNLMVEEIVEVNKNATKHFKLFAEDHNIHNFDFSLHHYLLVSNKLFYHFAETLPANKAADIHTPPPNFYFI